MALQLEQYVHHFTSMAIGQCVPMSSDYYMCFSNINGTAQVKYTDVFYSSAASMVSHRELAMQFTYYTCT